MLRYELRRRKNNIIFFTVITILMIWFYFIMLKTPEAVLYIVRKINDSEYILDFFGISIIQTITYENIMVTALSIMYTGIFIWLMYEVMKSVTREKRNGTVVYFLSQPVSYKKILLLKLIISMVIFICEISVWWILVWRISLHGATKSKYLCEIITERINIIMWAIVCASLLFIAIGFLYGCMYNGRGFIRFVIMFNGGIGFMSLLPNILRVGIGSLERKGLELGFYEKLLDIMYKLRKINPIYICNPIAVSNHGFSITAGVCLTIISIVCVVLGFIIFEKRCME